MLYVTLNNFRKTGLQTGKKSNQFLQKRNHNEILQKILTTEDFEEKKREFSLYPVPGESVKDSALDHEILT